MRHRVTFIKLSPKDDKSTNSFFPTLTINNFHVKELPAKSAILLNSAHDIVPNISIKDKLLLNGLSNIISNSWHCFLVFLILYYTHVMVYDVVFIMLQAGRKECSIRCQVGQNFRRKNTPTQFHFESWHRVLL